MKLLNLNSYVLNDTESVYFQKNTFELLGVQRNKGENINLFFERLKDIIHDNGYSPNILFLSINLYTEIQQLIESNELYKDMLISTDNYIIEILGISSDLIVYIPDSLKDKCRVNPL